MTDTISIGVNPFIIYDGVNLVNPFLRGEVNHSAGVVGIKTSVVKQDYVVNCSLVVVYPYYGG